MPTTIPGHENEKSTREPAHTRELKIALERHPHGRHWDKDVIRLCLTLWCRSPRGYTKLKNNHFIILPSQKLLHKYKNSVNQEAGINKDVLHWMKNGAMLKTGDVVLLRDKSAHRGDRPLGIISDVLPSDDMLTRKVCVRVYKDGKTVQYTRPISEMVLLVD